jgi:hypothetical protein
VLQFGFRVRNRVHTRQLRSSGRWTGARAAAGRLSQAMRWMVGLAEFADMGRRRSTLRHVRNGRAASHEQADIIGPTLRADYISQLCSGDRRAVIPLTEGRRWCGGARCPKSPMNSPSVRELFLEANVHNKVFCVAPDHRSGAAAHVTSVNN